MGVVSWHVLGATLPEVQFSHLASQRPGRDHLLRRTSYKKHRSGAKSEQGGYCRFMVWVSSLAASALAACACSASSSLMAAPGVLMSSQGALHRVVHVLMVHHTHLMAASSWACSLRPWDALCHQRIPALDTAHGVESHEKFHLGTQSLYSRVWGENGGSLNVL